MKLSFYTVTLLIITFVMLSCNKDQPPCYQPMQTQINFQFVARKLIEVDSVHNGELIDTFYFEYRDTFLNNSVIYTYNLEENYGIQNIGNATRISIPLNPSTDSIAYIFQMDSSIHILDTMSMKYTKDRKFISNACGFAFVYDVYDFKTTHHKIDSFILSRPLINTENDANVQLYFY